MKIFNTLWNKLIAGLVSRYGPALSISISGAVGAGVTKAIGALHEKVGPQAWEWISTLFHALPDDLEAQLTPERIGIAAGAVFYAALQEWLNRRQAKGIEAGQKALNSALPESQKVRVDGVARKDGETVEAIKTAAKKALDVGTRSRRG